MIDWSIANTIGIRTGKTTAICKAAKEINAIVITATKQEARRLNKTYDVKAASINDMLLGSNKPILFDTFGVAMIAHNYENKIRELKKEITELREALDVVSENK